VNIVDDDDVNIVDDDDDVQCMMMAMMIMITFLNVKIFLAFDISSCSANNLIKTDNMGRNTQLMKSSRW